VFHVENQLRPEAAYFSVMCDMMNEVGEISGMIIKSSVNVDTVIWTMLFLLFDYTSV